MSNISSIVCGLDVKSLESGLFQEMSAFKYADFSKCRELFALPASCFLSSGLEWTDGVDGMISVGDSAFSKCHGLKSIDIGSGITHVGTAAFDGCSALTYIDRLTDGDSSHTFDIVGDRAFADIGVTHANLALRSSSIYTFWGDECFADNHSLTSVSILSSCYMSNGMFRNCENLKQVEFLNSWTSYVYPYVFENCGSLTGITLPSKIWYISEGMFKGCSSLTSVGFDQYGSDSVLDLVQKCAFDGCENLQEIRFPQSITSIGQLEDACLSNCSTSYWNPLQLYFYGILPSNLVNENQYKTLDVIRQGKLITLQSNEVGKFSQIIDVLEKTRTSYCVMFNQCWEDNYRGCDSGEIHYATNWLFNGDGATYFNNSVQNKDAIFILVNDWLDDDLFDDYQPVGRRFTKEELDSAREKANERRQRYIFNKDTSKDILVYCVFNQLAAAELAKHLSKFPDYYLYVVAKKFLDHGSQKRVRYGINSKEDFSEIIDNNSFFPTAAKKNRRIYSALEWRPGILNTGFGRLCADCDVHFVSPPGSPTPYDYTYRYVYNDFKHDVLPYVPPQTYESDKQTSSDFTVGKAYYNAKELVTWAEDHNKPCLVICSLLGCEPCQIYQKNIWNNSEFQTWMGGQNFYFCAMEVEKQPFYDKELNYCVNELIPNAENFQKVDDPAEPLPNAFKETFKQIRVGDSINSTLYTPVLAFRAKNKAGDWETWLYTYHSISKWISEVGVNGVIQCLKSLCLYHFDGNVIKSDGYVRNAGKAFDLYDYKTANSANPYQISPIYVDKKTGWEYAKWPNLPLVISLKNWQALGGKDFNTVTPDDASFAIKTRFSKNSTESNKYPEYIGHCLFTQIDWLTMSLESSEIGQLESAANANVINEILSPKKFLVRISNDYYAFQVDGSKTVKAKTPCGFDDPSFRPVLYRYYWVKQAAPDWSKYKNS